MATNTKLIAVPTLTAKEKAENEKRWQKNKRRIEQREAENQKWMLTRAEIAQRVRKLRTELEAAKQRYDGALFDNYTDGIPRSLDICDVNREPFGAVYFLSPFLERMVKNLQDATDPGKQSDDVFELYFWSTDTAYQVGMLAVPSTPTVQLKPSTALHADLQRRSRPVTGSSRRENSYGRGEQL